MTELITVEDLANYLSVNVRTIYRLLERGNIPAIKVGRQWRFDRALIDKWLKQRTVRTKASILVIDDDEVICSLFKETLQELGHRVTTVESGFTALALMKQQHFDLVFLDLKMPGIDGAELFREIKIIRPELPVTIITGYPESELMARALAQGPFGVMNKPFSESDIVAAVEIFLRLM